MITPERVYEVFGITPGPWWSEGEYLAAMVEGKRPNGEVIGRMSPSIQRLFTMKQNSINAKCATASPQMLVALVNVLERNNREFILDHGTQFMIVKAIESADSKGRKWPEILKALE